LLNRIRYDSLGGHVDRMPPGRGFISVDAAKMTKMIMTQAEVFLYSPESPDKTGLDTFLIGPKSRITLCTTAVLRRR
jgi:hypothetical protein